MEQFANNPSTTLASAITLTSATSISVSSSSGFPSGGNFRILIDSELMEVTAISGTTWTVVRGDGGTTAATHLISANVYGVVTKEAMDALVSVQSGGSEVSSRRVLNFIGATVADNSGNSRADITISGATYGAGASKPSAGQAGRIYVPSDGAIVSVDTGSAWVGLNPTGSVYTIPPTASNWTNMIKSGATASVIDIPGGGITLQANGASGDTFVGIARQLSASTYTLIGRIRGSAIWSNGLSMGIYVAAGTASSSGIRSFDVQVNSMAIGTWTSGYASTRSNPVNTTGIYSQGDIWLKIVNDGVHRNFYFSNDGLTWNQYYQETATTLITETYAGFCVDPNIGGTVYPSFPSMSVDLYSWSGA